MKADRAAAADFRASGCIWSAHLSCGHEDAINVKLLPAIARSDAVKAFMRAALIPRDKLSSVVILHVALVHIQCAVGGDVRFVSI
jgi:hypothetical protein